MKALGICSLNDGETNLLLVCRNMLTLKYDSLLSKCSIAIVLTRIPVGVDDPALVLRSIIHNMADELTNPVRNPLVCLKYMDQFDYNCRTYYFSK